MATKQRALTPNARSLDSSAFACASVYLRMGEPPPITE